MQCCLFSLPAGEGAVVAPSWLFVLMTSLVIILAVVSLSDEEDASRFRFFFVKGSGEGSLNMQNMNLCENTFIVICYCTCC